MGKGSFAKGAAGVASKHINWTQAIAEVIASYARWKKIMVTEQTKQKEIEADKEIALAEIKAKQDIFLNYLESSFSERQESFNKLFELADNAIDKGDFDALALTLKSVGELVQNSPLKDLIDTNKVMLELNNPNHKFSV